MLIVWPKSSRSPLIESLTFIRMSPNIGDLVAAQIALIFPKVNIFPPFLGSNKFFFIYFQGYFYAAARGLEDLFKTLSCADKILA